MSAPQTRSKPTKTVETAKPKNQPAGSSEPLQAARRESAEAKIAEYVSRTVVAAPPLDEEKRARLSVLLRPIVNGDVAARAVAK